MKGSKLTLILDIIAVVRLTKLILEDEITQPLRDLVHKRFPPNTKLGYLFTCPWCMSIWVGASIFGLRRLSPELATTVSSILTASQITGLSGRLSDDLQARGW